MSFPLNPVQGQQYTNALGTKYQYDSTRTAWLINDQNTGGGGTGTTNVVTKFVDGPQGVIGDSLITDDGFTVRVNGLELSANTGNGTVRVGELAGYYSDSTGNVFVGERAGFSDSTSSPLAHGNVAVGYFSLTNNSIGDSNTSIGSSTLYNNTSGRGNNAMGHSALSSNTVGTANVAIGNFAQSGNISGFSNVAVGNFALDNNQAGLNNVAVGYRAGSTMDDTSIPNTSCNASVYIGFESHPKDNSGINEIVIGTDAVGLGSNTVIIGNSNITTTALRGNVGIDTTTPGYSLDVDGSCNTTGYYLNGVPLNLTGGGLSGSGTATYVPQFSDSTTLANSTMKNYAGKGMELNVGNSIDSSSYLVVKGNGNTLAEIGRSNVSGSGSGELNLYDQGVQYTHFNPSSATVGSGLSVTGKLAVGPVSPISGPATHITQTITPGSAGPGMLCNVGPITADCTRVAPDTYNTYATTHISDVIRLDRTKALSLYDIGTISDTNYLFFARGFIWQVAAGSASYADYIDFVCYPDTANQYITLLHTTGSTSTTADQSNLNLSVVQPNFLGDVFWDSAKLVLSSNIPGDSTGLIGYDIKTWTCKA